MITLEMAIATIKKRLKMLQLNKTTHICCKYACH